MKKNFFGLFAFLVAIGLSAFSPKTNTAGRDGELWFHFTGNPSDPAEVADKDNYDQQDPTCVATNATLCDIKIKPLEGSSPVRPDLNQQPVDHRDRIQ